MRFHICSIILLHFSMLPLPTQKQHIVIFEIFVVVANYQPLFIEIPSNTLNSIETQEKSYRGTFCSLNNKSMRVFLFFFSFICSIGFVSHVMWYFVVLSIVFFCSLTKANWMLLTLKFVAKLSTQCILRFLVIKMDISIVLFFSSSPISFNCYSINAISVIPIGKTRKGNNNYESNDIDGDDPENSKGKFSVEIIQWRNSCHLNFPRFVVF